MADASDTFDTAISANWENGGGSWGPARFITGGHVSAPASALAALRWSANEFQNDQFSEVTFQAYSASGDYVGPAVRMKAGTDESAYVGFAHANPVEVQLNEYNSSFGATNLGVLAISPAHTWVAGDRLRLTVTGTSFQAAYNWGGGLVDFGTPIVDATITSGSAGMAFTVAVDDRTQVTSWIGGAIVAVGSLPLMNRFVRRFPHLRM